MKHSKAASANVVYDVSLAISLSLSALMSTHSFDVDEI